MYSDVVLYFEHTRVSAGLEHGHGIQLRNVSHIAAIDLQYPVSRLQYTMSTSGGGGEEGVDTGNFSKSCMCIVYIAKDSETLVLNYYLQMYIHVHTCTCVYTWLPREYMNV